MKKGLLILTPLLFSALVQAKDLAATALGSYDFVAPTVTSQGAVTDATVGLIVYDASANGFYGRAVGGSWVNLNASVVANNYVILKQVVASGGSGDGTCSAASTWYQRNLNTIDNPQAWVTLASNQFTLAAGTYTIEGSAPAYLTNEHQVKLHNDTDNTDVVLGTSEFCDVSAPNQSRSTIAGTFTIVTQKTFEIQHACFTASSATDAFGVPTGGLGSNDVYTVMKITKIN
jgi:hypothetical protein